jgi:hypothetical protein
MKTIVKTDTNISVLLYDDDKVIDIQEYKTVVGDPEESIIMDCYTDNAIVYENVVQPEDWQENKYLFDGETWTVHPDWTPPEPAPHEE